MPGASNVCENCSSVSSTGDLNFCSVLTMLCGTSSWLVHVTVRAGFTVVVAGAKLKLSTTTGGCAVGRRFHLVLERHVGDRDRVVDVVEGHPGQAEHFLQPIGLHLHRPGRGAAPGAGCGNAVDIAVWNVTCPSTFCIT